MNGQKILVFLCIVVLGTAMILPAQAKVTNAQKVLWAEGPDGLWKLINKQYGFNMYLAADTASLTIWSPDGPVLAVEDSDEVHPQTTYRVSMQETEGIGFTVEQIDLYFSVPRGQFIQMSATEALLQDGPVHIEPYGSYTYRSGCPAIGNYRFEVVAVSGTDDNGHELEFFGVMQRLNAMADTSSANEQYDTENLRYNADYETEVAKDVWWVPAVSLGQSRYTNRQIAEMVEMKPEEKQESISTLYEAIQLFQISNFAEADDNVRIRENKLYWEHHKPGYDAVRTNEGCCATDSNWLNYILKEDYEQVGFLAYSQKDGSGHILNYLYQDGYYYFIDLTHYRTDFPDASAPETGNMKDYRQSDIILGNLHKALSPEAYVKYCVDSFNDPPARFFLYRAENCLPVTSKEIDHTMTIIYPKGTDITVLDGKDASALDVLFAKAPKKNKKWSSIKSARFHVDEKYLTGPEKAAQPLSSYTEGDLLSLEDHGENGFAVIDGIEYSVCKTDDCEFIFEGNMNLYGGNNYSYVNQELPPSEALPGLEGMDSIVLGEIAVSILKKEKKAQIILCDEEYGRLKVSRVMDNTYYYTMPSNLYRDEDGEWMKLPVYWFLMIFEDDSGVRYEFGRFNCDLRN